MIIERNGSDRIKILAPAKLNLFLEVTGQRPDGYHELDTIMHSVDLYDSLEICRAGREPLLRTRGRPMGPPEHNLAFRAAQRFNAGLGKVQGIEIRLDKRIPPGGGLGGGSSDCAAVLIGLNELFQRPFSAEQLSAMGAELGSDVPFFLTCGTAHCRGRGEIVTAVEGVPPLHFLVIYPGFQISTRKVYENLNLGLTECKNSHTLLSALLKSTETAEINKCLFNRLERAALELSSDLRSAREKARNIGLRSIRVTGSGSSIFQLYGVQDLKKKQPEFFHIDNRWESFLVTSSPMLRV